ncbi:MAG: asparagine synthase-related protein [Sphingopyxis sp.]|uniref:asparagine synthase-related protein n=1 Tax=Sphingopyxis sp. TaxID=1908224 RepID=UPI002AB89C21|nr:asparagine synthase-related protein [Sphingopyxis sp.]MDZ3831948.1 asparagine synthase-related protein [Sphingopyxis sp.]
MKRGVLAFFGERRAGIGEAAHRNQLLPIETFPGLSLYAGRELRARRIADGSFIVGDIFSRRGSSIAETGEGWGNFLAFCQNGSRFFIERAPMTGMPLYWARHRDGIVCASHLPLLDGLAIARGIDWTFVAHCLAFRNLRTERTGLAGCAELLPGSRLALDGGELAIEQTWTPWDHVDKPNFVSASELASALERQLLACTSALTASRRDIVLELSGGLDSSIVAATLANAGAECSAITFATLDADGDERPYARAVAERCGMALCEVEHDDRLIDLAAPPAHRHFRPGAYAVLGGIDRAFDAAVGERDVSIVGGIGGDNVFAFDNTVAPILDAASHFGLGRRAFTAMRDVARASNASLWDAAKLSWRAWWKGPRQHWERDYSFLAPDAVPDEPFRHPWDEGGAAASQAKRNHVEAIRRILDFLDRPGRWYDRDVVAPLLSQPVVEFCLEVPSWTWVSGGRDRAIARAAFADRLPPEVVWRRGKGRIESLCVAAYLKQRPALRELLLGGRLADRGLLDLPSIEAYFARDNLDGNFDYFRLLEIADAERWVRSTEAAFECGPSVDQR